MKLKSFLTALSSIALLSNCNFPALAETVSLKAGYFNLATIKNKYQPAKDAESFRDAAEAELRADVEKGNQDLLNAQKSGASKDQLAAMARELQATVNAKQQELIKQSQTKGAVVAKSIEAAVASVAERQGLQLVVDGAGVYAGGDRLVDNGSDVTEAVLDALGVGTASQIKAAKSFPFDLAYFNKTEVLKLYPHLNNEERRLKAEQLLRREVDECNQKIQDAKAQGKSKQELEQMAKSMQAVLDAKQQALIQLVREENADLSGSLAALVAKSASGRANLVLEGSSVYFGRASVTGSGIDLTPIICRGTGASPGAPATQGAADTTAHASVTTPPVPAHSAPAASSQPVVSASTVDTPIRDKWAVVVGISQFSDPRINLKFAAKDAQDFRNFLIKEQNFKPDHIVTLLNEQATRANIMSAFGSRWLPNVAEPGDLVVVYISTHGTPSSIDNGGRNYVVAYDTNVNDLYATGVDMDELSRRIKEGVKADRALIVLDTCFSGNASIGTKGINRVANFDLKNFAVGNGHMIISSSSSNQASWESKTMQNGIFTHYLIESLRAKGGNVKAAFDELQSQVQWEVKRDYGAQQEPQLHGDWQGKTLVISNPATSPRPMTGVPGEQVIIPTASQIKPPVTQQKPVAH